jgi:predicted porin
VSSAKLSQGAAETKRMSFGFVQPLSKRTDLYATYARNTNSGGAARGLNGAVTAANASSTGYDFGVKHAF